MTLSETKIYAALDLGSNSFHLLIATFKADRLVVIDDVKYMVRLAAGLQTDRSLSAESMQTALDALHIFADRLKTVPSTNIRVVGTNTLRAAKNADSFLEQAEKVLSVPIDIISGAEEARLIYIGVSKDYTPTSKRLIIDIGGGSTELIVGQTEPEELESLHMGCVSFSRRFFGDGKITARSYRDALLAARTEIQVITAEMQAAHWQEAIGSSGTIKAVQRILQKEFHEPYITRRGLEKLSEKLISTGAIDQLKLQGLSERRRPVIVGGIAILHALFIELNIDDMLASDHAVREGIIYEMAGKTDHENRRERTIAQMQTQYHVDVEHCQRVMQIATWLLQKLDLEFAAQPAGIELLQWAAQLHEIGLHISHSNYQKHSAYILENSFMPGFSRQAQQSLAYLALNHRRKIRDIAPHYRVNTDMRLLLVLRLACLFCRRRSDPQLPDTLELKLKDKALKLQLEQRWLDQHPLTQQDLEQEKLYLQAHNINLQIKAV